MQSANRIVDKIPEPLAVVGRRNAGHIFAQESALKKVLQVLAHFEHSQYVDNRKHIHEFVLSTQHSSFYLFEDVSLLVCSHFSLVSDKGHHQRVIIDVILFKKLAVGVDLVAESFSRLLS